MQNLSSENEFVLHEKELVCGTHFHLNGFALVLTEVPGNSEMAYCFVLVKNTSSLIP